MTLRPEIVRERLRKLREVHRMLQSRLGDFTDFADQLESFLDERVD